MNRCRRCLKRRTTGSRSRQTADKRETRHCRDWKAPTAARLIAPALQRWQDNTFRMPEPLTTAEWVEVMRYSSDQSDQLSKIRLSGALSGAQWAWYSSQALEDRVPPKLQSAAPPLVTCLPRRGPCR